METVYKVILSRAERGMADLLLTLADYFYCQGAGIVSDAPADAGVRDLLTTIEQRYQTEVLALRELSDATRAPGWLRAMASQADTIEPAPIDGWPV